MKKYSEWKQNETETVTKNVLMTLSYIDKHKGRDEGNAYSSSQLDDIEHCVNILCKIDSMHTHYSNGTNSMLPSKM